MRFIIPFPAKPKARPRHDSRSGRTHMPADYMDWKDKVVAYLRLTGQTKQPFTGNVRVSMVIGGGQVEVLILPAMISRPKGVGGDLDNLAAGVLDAIQDAGLFPNDRNVMELSAIFESEEVG